MKTEDLKGHLLARRANLEASNQHTMSQILVMKENLRDIESRFAGCAGAVAELTRTLELIEPKETKP